MTRSFVSVWQLWVSWCSTPSLTRGWVCNLLVQLLLVLARAVTLGSKSRRTRDHILLSHLRLPQPGVPGFRIYIPREQGGPVIPPGTGFCNSPLEVSRSRSRSYFTTDSQSANMSWYQVPLWDLRPDIISCRNVAVWNLLSCIYWAPSLTRGQFFSIAYITPGRITWKTIAYPIVASLPGTRLPSRCVAAITNTSPPPRPLTRYRGNTL
jgi:hypothetical protein